MAQYADPQVLVTTEWVELHRIDPNVVVIEVDESPDLYARDHIPGAISWSWEGQLADKLRRDILGPSQVELLLSASGVGNTTTIVLYGDKHNLYAAWAFWQLKIHGHRDTRIINGGREKWLDEGRPSSKEMTISTPNRYHCRSLNLELRALLPQVKVAVKSQTYSVVDARPYEEFTGAAPSRDGGKDIAQRSGHIPGARNIPWDAVCKPDGTFKDADTLRELFEAKGITPEKEVITYSGTGERASLTWFVIKHLLGYPVVKNYDGSWAEWGNLVGVAIEQGEERPPRYARVGNDAVR
jgi:thiosulfate/3-mercaptopyruvate sulfurtransferase